MKSAVISALVASLIAFFVGYDIADTKGERNLLELRDQYAQKELALKTSYIEKEKQINESLALAFKERDDAHDRLRVLERESNRLRDEATEARRRLAKGNSACHNERTKLADCSRLIERFSEFGERCVRFSEDVAVKKDALAKMVQ